MNPASESRRDHTGRPQRSAAAAVSAAVSSTISPWCQRGHTATGSAPCRKAKRFRCSSRGVLSAGVSFGKRGRPRRCRTFPAFTLAETICAAAGLALLATSAGSLLTLAGRNHASAAARIRALAESELVMETFRNAVGNAHRVVVEPNPGPASDQRQLVLERSPSISLRTPTRILFKVNNNQLIRTGGNFGANSLVVNGTVESLVFRYGVPGADGNLEIRDIQAIPNGQRARIVAVEVDLTLRYGTTRVRETATFRIRPVSALSRIQPHLHRSAHFARERNV